MNRTRISFFILALITLACFADQPTDAKETTRRTAAEEVAEVKPPTHSVTAEEKEGAEAFRHHFSAFVGNTHYEGRNYATVGPEYEFRFNRKVGVGAFADFFRAQADRDEAASGEKLERGESFQVTVIGALGFLHPFRKFDLHFFGGPAVEFEPGRRVWGARVGAGYEFGLGRGWTMAITTEFDVTSAGTVFAVGGMPGRGFRPLP